jgi:hypothetical protein
MSRQRIALSALSCLIAAMVCSDRALAEEPECATNYHNDGNSAETFVMTRLTPPAVVERLPRLLVAAGVVMQWAEPGKGVIKAEGLDVKAQTSGDATRVSFHSSSAADKSTLCRYAALVGSPPLVKKAVAQDPALIARMQDDLLKRHQIIEPGASSGLNNAEFHSLSDFLDFAITDIRVEAGKHVYEISMLLPRSLCGIASEDIDDTALVMIGQRPNQHPKPARVEAMLVYEGEGVSSHLTDATIKHIESTK